MVCCDAAGRLTVNGEPLEETCYLYAGPGRRPCDRRPIRFDVVVPASHSSCSATTATTAATRGATSMTRKARRQG